MIKISGVSKKFSDFELKNINLDINKGAYLVILGPSGSGKTVLLEIIANVEKMDSGNITGVDHSRIGFIYQDLMLFPHMTVFENIAYGLRMRGVEKDIIKKEVESCSQKLQIAHLLGRSIKTLSGGEKQRTAIARAIVFKPDLLLFDEPTSALDQNIKNDIQKLFRQIHRETGATVIHVTHDFNEALSVADEIAILNDGTIVQSGTPETIFNFPANSAVADFLGFRNVYQGKVKDNCFLNNGKRIYIETQDCENVYIAVRSEEIILSIQKMESSARNSFQGKVTDIEKKYSGADVTVDVGFEIHSNITGESLKKLDLFIGKEVFITFKSSSVKVFNH
jgi:molybdopterin-binding protein